MTATRLCDNMILDTTTEDPTYTAPAGTTATRDGKSEAVLSSFTSSTTAATTGGKLIEECPFLLLPNARSLSLNTSTFPLCQTSRQCHHDTRWGKSVVGDTGGNSSSCSDEGENRAIVDGRPTGESVAVDTFGAQAQAPGLSSARCGRGQEGEEVVCCTSIEGCAAARVIAATAASCSLESLPPLAQLPTDAVLAPSSSSFSSSSSSPSLQSPSPSSAPPSTAAINIEPTVAAAAAAATSTTSVTEHQLQEHPIAFEGDLLSRPPAPSRLSLTLSPPPMAHPTLSHSSSSPSTMCPSSPNCSPSALPSSSSSSSSLSSTFSAWSSFSSARSRSTSCSTSSDASPSPFLESLPPPSLIETHPAPTDPSTVNTASPSIHCADIKTLVLQEHRTSDSKLKGPSVDTETGISRLGVFPDSCPYICPKEHTQDSQNAFEHPHIIYPHAQYSDASSSSSSSSSSSFSTPPSALPPWTPNTDSELYTQNPWDSYQERCDVFDENEDDAASDERPGLFSQESDDSDPELKRARDQHPPMSFKRRKVSVDELEILGEDNGERSPSSRPSSGRTASSAGAVERQSRPASWPARKRRSLLPDYSRSVDHADQDQDQQPEQQPEQQQQPSCTPDLANNLDTSSLSLLSATSALVSAGADLSLDLDSQVPVASVPSPSAESSCRQVPVFSVSLLDDLSPPPSLLPIRSSKTTTAAISTSCKRSFEEAIELTRPLGNDPALDHSGWFESNKRRKVHHFPMRWTSTLSPSPYVKLMSMRDFWDVMKSRIDLSWLDLWAVFNANSQSTAFDWCQWRKNSICSGDRPADQDLSSSISTSDQALPDTSVVATLRACPKQPKGFGSVSEFRTQKIVMQYPSAGLLLKGLWEEEEKSRRERQMIPDGVHKPMRSKILTRKPLPRIGALRISSRSLLRESDTPFQQLTSSSSSTSESVYATPSAPAQHDCDSPSPEPSQAEYDEVVRRKNGVTTAVPAHALSEGYDLGDYKPWKDGTVLPHQGSIPRLNQLRQSTLMEPWPLEETQAKDECTRMLHRMREQLNVVINLQIHLRSLVRSSAFGAISAADSDATAASDSTGKKECMAGPTTSGFSLPSSSQMSFLLSIRHPGQVSIDLLRALYGPGFLQTNAFRSIEQLLWGPHLHVHRERLPSPKAEYHPRYTSHDGGEYCRQGTAEYGYQSHQGEQVYNNSNHHHYHHQEDHGYDHGYQHEHKHEHAMEAPLDSNYSSQSSLKETTTTTTTIVNSTMSKEKISMVAEGHDHQTQEDAILQLEVGYGNRF
ncbi:hypothetical protein EMPS_05036 [Entomortierella parvispora]|uniref:Uncharacterized protein n=1 Tax=Entomortierella parvispora TaxID=205924 RepID=A0A9P3HAA5_9FUNG|nr:hypothetical protein EMPS_05036 [Entomortierella parvispora]